MRGEKNAASFFNDSASRITPACAGKSLHRLDDVALQWDHPRIRGEKGCGNGRRVPMMGSPPHTRGKVSLPSYLFSLLGITPAYAGKR